MIALVYSSSDPAGSGIASYIREVCRSEEIELSGSSRAWALRGLDAVMLEFDVDVIYFDFLDEVVSNVAYYVFLSRHSSSAGIRSLTTHHTGNPYGSADAGGRPYELSFANPPLAWAFLKGMAEGVDSSGLTGFRVVYEATHHGPTNLTKPLTFIEIGSTPQEWRLRKAHELLGNVIIDSVKHYSNLKCIPTGGFGGQHYAEKFSERALRLGECFGHIIPRYALRELKKQPQERLREVITSSLMKSVPKASRAVVLKKAGARVREVLEAVAEELGVEVIKV